jgi:hypothetical protein
LGSGQRRQTALGVVAVLFEMPLHHHVEQLAIGRGEGALFEQNLPQRFGLVQHPGVHGRNQSIATDEVHLQGQNAEEQITVRGRLGHGLTS